ncbi:MAG: aspartate aminotransferase family protein [Burkholderiaceae bacterium]
MNTYARLPVAFSHGEGAWVWSADGRKFLDGLSGIAVNTLGHNHPRLTAGLREQVGRLIHTSNIYGIPLQQQLAERLVALSGMTNVFFCNSGLEANEAAIKLARKHGHAKGHDFPKIIVFEGAFHGRSLATLSATANPKVHKGFEPLVEGFVRLPLNDIGAIRTALAQQPDIAAVFLESIQGEGGIRPAQITFLKELRALCTEHDVLLMLDEVQCGIGRTGKWFAHQWADVLPDVMPLAKGLGSGVPIGAVVAHGKAASLFEPGNHGTTFGGNPLAMRAGLETLAAVEEEGLLANAAARGQQIRDGLAAALSGMPGLREIRGQGLMIGVELQEPCTALATKALEAGLLINVTADRVIRLLPPLVIKAEEADQIVQILAPLIRDFLQGVPSIPEGRAA